jgi:hypothetical protein
MRQREASHNARQIGMRGCHLKAGRQRDGRHLRGLTGTNFHKGAACLGQLPADCRHDLPPGFQPVPATIQRTSRIKAGNFGSQ